MQHRTSSENVQEARPPQSRHACGLLLKAAPDEGPVHPLGDGERAISLILPVGRPRRSRARHHGPALGHAVCWKNAARTGRRRHRGARLPPTSGPPGTGRRLRSLARPALALLAGIVALWWLLPRATGVAWSAMGPVLVGVGPPRLVLLTLLWVAGLVAHSFVLTGALPGLSRRRALTLNLTGSAVSNVAPLGGALGVATNESMTTAWGFTKASFAAFTVVSNIWDVLAKLALPTIVLGVLLTLGVVPGGGLRTTAVAATVAMLSLCALWVALLTHDGTARALARFVRRTARRWLPAGVVERVDVVVDGARQARAHSRTIITMRWPQLTAGMGAYVILQGVLLWACLTVSGADAPLSAVSAGFAVERLVSMAVLTPGGTGLTEAATAATIVALGGSPLGVVVGVLLYRGFTFLLEIPVGGLWLAGWLALRSRASGGRA